MSMSTISKFVLAGCMLATALLGQDFRATITGTVTDATGAGVPKVQIEARNVSTSAIATAQTNDTGAYTIPFLVPGTYTVKATATGFKQALHEGLELHAGDKVQADLKLEVGALSESVTVTGQSEQLRTGTASMGQTINTTEARDLPIMGRNTYMLADLATGMYTALNTTSTASGFGRPYDGASAQMSSEGIGSQYQIMLNANSFAGNAAKNARGVMRWNQPGFVIDGPVRIPHVYNGKDKTFFMFNMEWIRNASPLPYTASYPTAAIRTGDFSSLVNASGAPVI